VQQAFPFDQRRQACQNTAGLEHVVATLQEIQRWGPLRDLDLADKIPMGEHLRREVRLRHAARRAQSAKLSTDVVQYGPCRHQRFRSLSHPLRPRGSPLA
jgi:hypothetical protein